MHINKKDLLSNFELYLGGLFITVTVVIVIMNVFTRYFLHFTFFWTEEIAVGCFVWTIFLGATGAFKKKNLMGVDILMQVTKGVARKIFVLINSIVMSVITIWMGITSYGYVSSSTKITAALEISYQFITVSIVIAFALMSIYSLITLYKSIKAFFVKEEIREVKI